MRTFLLPALVLASLTGCASTSEELLPIPAAIKGASRIDAVEIVVRPTAAAAIARLNQGAPGTTGSQDPRPQSIAAAAVPFEEMLARTIRDVARKRGLISGRPLKLLVEIDEVQTANAASAIIGRDDRLAGSVFVRDAASGEALGQLYISIVNANGGLMSVITRAGGVREKLAEAFAEDIARALSAPR